MERSGETEKIAFLLEDELEGAFFEALNALSATDFEKSLAKAAIDNLGFSGPLCLNNFAYALRELLRHILHRLAPDEEVLRCEWLPQDRAESKRLHRADRIKYIIQGGMSDWAARSLLLADVKKAIGGLLEVNNTLSAYTHVNENTFATESAEVAATVNKSLRQVAELVNTIASGKELLAEFLEPVSDEYVLEQFLFETHQNLDELSTHHWINQYEIYSVEIAEIGSRTIEVEIQGNVDVEMQYGSDSDVRRDIGARMRLSWPFTAKILVDIVRPLGSKSQLVFFEVDTSEWYE